MGMFSGIGDKEVYEKGTYLAPNGLYELEVRNVILKETRASGLGFIVEFRVLASNMEEHPVGSKATWFQKMQDKDIALPAIKAFFIALMNVNMYDPEEKHQFNNELEDLLDTATSFVPEKDENGVMSEHPLSGLRVRCETQSKFTKKGMNFTAHNWAPSRFNEAA